jgi:hypothetical protein
MIFSSAVISGIPRVIAVATMMRSAGSPWKSGNRQLAMEISAVSGASETGDSRLAENQDV